MKRQASKAVDYQALIGVVRSAISSMQALGGAGGAWLDLGIRFWLAKGFLVATSLSMAMHTPLTMAFVSPVSPTVDWMIASPLGAMIATVCPILLLVGCCSHIASLPLPFEALCLARPTRPVAAAPVLGRLARLDHCPRARTDFTLTHCCLEVWFRLQSPVRKVSVKQSPTATRILEPYYRLALKSYGLRPRHSLSEQLPGPT